MMLGTDEIRCLTLCISLGQHFGSGQRAMRRLWRHAFARAMVAEPLAGITGVATEAGYMAGLLADIGIYGLMVSFPEPSSGYSNRPVMSRQWSPWRNASTA